MRDFFLKLFSEHNSDLEITLFNGWHFFYLFLIFGSVILLTFLFRNRSERAKNIVVSIYAYVTIGLYVADFFIMPLSDSYNGISVYKLPFNICTIMAVMVPFAQFNKKFAPIKSAVVVLSMASSLMWMCYPGTALGGQPPFSYVIFQTFMYHGFLFGWGFLSVTLDGTRMEIKKCWKEFVGILMIFVWACFGNGLYGDWNWFFIQKSIFPFFSDEIMPLVVIVAVFGVCLSLYGVYYAVQAIEKKIVNKKKATTKTGAKA